MIQSEINRYDESGVPNTHKLIDEVIGMIRNSDCDGCAIDILEQIRSHNSNLSEWGAETNYNLIVSNDEIEDLKSRISEMAE